MSILVEKMNCLETRGASTQYGWIDMKTISVIRLIIIEVSTLNSVKGLFSLNVNLCRIVNYFNYSITLFFESHMTTPTSLEKLLILTRSSVIFSSLTLDSFCWKLHFTVGLYS